MGSVLFISFKCNVDNAIAVWLTFVTHSVRIRPNFQGLPWFELDGFVEDVLQKRYAELIIWRICCDFIFSSLGANLVQVFIAYGKRSTDHFPT